MVSSKRKIIFIGDSITMGYMPLVQELMRTQPVTIEHTGGGDSAQVRANLDEWAIRVDPDILHLNCGLHDLRFNPATKMYQCDIAEYERNLCEIIRRLKEHTSSTIVWATITPVLDARHNMRKSFHRYQRDVTAYNFRALGVMGAAKIRINDLHGRIISAGLKDCLADDGVHMTEKGNEVLANAVVTLLQEELGRLK